MKISSIFKRLLRAREYMRECGEFEPAPPPAPRRESYVVDPRDDRPSIDMLTAKYNDAVDIMNQQTAALLAACGVLQTYKAARLSPERVRYHALACHD